MIFTDHQYMLFKSRALFLLSKLDNYLKATNEMKAEHIVAEFQEVCSMGRSIALDEVRSTPWEYLTLYASSHTDETLNAAAAQGWEFLCPFDGGKVLFRRRKAVAEIAAKEKPE